MFKKLFSGGSRANQASSDALYEKIVAAARQPVIYSDWGVPDTPLGRFEMVSLHVFLVLRRLRGETGRCAEIAQELTDAFFRDMDHSLRELGIGDLSVPKRMKELAKMFYGRVVSYGEALDRNDRAALAAALARNVKPGVASWPEGRALAAYAASAGEALSRHPAPEMAAGTLEFPVAGPSLAGEAQS
jgi:cytochrome b pre-mRNA-processing protein 3